MIERRIIEIDAEKCNGCGLCASACHEGAIQMIDGIATLIRDDYCDGLGDCLPACPTNAIKFVHRKALAFDRDAVIQNMKVESTVVSKPIDGAKSALSHWPVQIKLAPTNAGYFDGCDLLIAADCAAYSYSNFHSDFMNDKITLIGCPKLDSIDYSEKLTVILKENKIKSLTVVRMEVPCCGGLEHACVTALKHSGKFIPWQVVTLSLQGDIL